MTRFPIKIQFVILFFLLTFVFQVQHSFCSNLKFVFIKNNTVQCIVVNVRKKNEKLTLKSLNPLCIVATDTSNMRAMSTAFFKRVITQV